MRLWSEKEKGIWKKTRIQGQMDSIREDQRQYWESWTWISQEQRLPLNLVSP